MTDKLGYCSEHLCKAVVYMAASDGTSQEKLRGMAANTGFGSIAEDDFPSSTLSKTAPQGLRKPTHFRSCDYVNNCGTTVGLSRLVHDFTHRVSCGPCPTNNSILVEAVEVG
jgi:hypothetical protein